MKKHFYHIKNPNAYFKRSEHNRMVDEIRKEQKHKENDIHISEILPENNKLKLSENDTDNNYSIAPLVSLSSLQKSKEFDDVENEYKHGSSLHWIDLIQNKKLHKTIECLSDEEKIFISLIFYEQKTQDELAQLYNINQSSVFYKINKIIRKIKIFMSK